MTHKLEDSSSTTDGKCHSSLIHNSTYVPSIHLHMRPFNSCRNSSLLFLDVSSTEERVRSFFNIYRYCRVKKLTTGFAQKRRRNWEEVNLDIIMKHKMLVARRPVKVIGDDAHEEEPAKEVSSVSSAWTCSSLDVRGMFSWDTQYILRLAKSWFLSLELSAVKN